MPRRVKNGSPDTRDWIVRASEQMSLARALSPGPARDTAIRKAEQFQTAVEMMGFLRTSDTKPER